MTIPAWFLLVGGLSLLLLLAFQIAVGKRWIKLGRKHLKIHTWVAWAMLAFAIAHGLGGLVYAGLIDLP